MGSRVGFDDRQPQSLLAAEVLVDSATGVAGLGGDLLDRRPEEAPAQEHPVAGAQQVLMGAYLLFGPCQPDHHSPIQ
jgi:hypothetical protein